MAGRKGSLLIVDQPISLWNKTNSHHLFNFSEVILRVLVEHEFSYGTQRVVLVGPNFGQVQNVVTELFSLLWSHSLLNWRLAIEVGGINNKSLTM
jgi:hypothetical protein